MIMKITRLNEVEKCKVDMEGAKGAFKQIPISKQDGTPSYSFRVFTIEPCGYTPYHQHPYEHLNYVIEGSAVIMTESGEEKEIKKGDFALVLPDEKHQYRNKSAVEPFVMICAVPKESE
jgi:quercetin dioxygenase-like cupin family protein